MALYKKLDILVLLICCSTYCLANRIDSLQTDKQVLSFVKELFPEYKGQPEYFSDYYNENIKTADSLKVKNWTKIDFDQNGETDIVVFNTSFSEDFFLILSKSGKYQKIQPYFDHCKYDRTYPVVTAFHNIPVILFYNQYLDGYDDSIKRFNYTKLTTDTLHYFNGYLLNYVSKPQRNDIHEIILNNDGRCEGSCPLIHVEIDAKAFKSSAYKEIDWDHNPKKLTGHLSIIQIKKLLDVLNNSDFLNFNNVYDFSCTDQPTTVLTIKYNNGNIKQISDYGWAGNFSLGAIYKLICNVKWHSQ